MERIILHSDMNSFYASVEQAEDVSLHGKPVVVAGNPELRHGIILARSVEAKAYGIKTAEALWQACEKCPELIVVPPRYSLYRKYSQMAHDIYYQYTDLVEPFGMDECWLDITGSINLHGGRVDVVAEEISERIKAELGATVSIGVSWNKIFAKFGSDYRKPDAITYITHDNYRDIVWKAPVRDLLYVGAATERKLHSYGIETIGDLAHASDAWLQNRLGKMGFILRSFAQGNDATPVKEYNPDAHLVNREVKSYGNGLTSPHDLTTYRDVETLIWILSESVAQRLREDGMRAKTISVGARSNVDLSSWTRQITLMNPTAATRLIARTAYKLLIDTCKISNEHPLRALYVRVTNLSSVRQDEQLSLFPDEALEWERLDTVIDELRHRFGNTCIVRGVELQDKRLAGLDIKAENTVHPESYFHV